MTQVSTFGLGLVGIAAMALVGCSDSGSNSPYVEVRGGGFIFNYRIAEATAGVVVAPLRTST